MEIQGAVQSIVNLLVVFATDMLIPVMALAFLLGVALRFTITWTVRREMWFAKEFEKRVHAFLSSDEAKENKSFYINAKRLLEKTYYELFEVRAIMKRRNPDLVASLFDRMFMIQHGCAWLVRDTLKQIRFLKHGKGHPKLHEISKTVFQNNPCFTKLFGVVPGGKFNDILNILPGLFIVGGIFGTFLGIMKALPELSEMDLNDIDGTKLVMDTFLLKISFSMSTSIVGILLSVAMNFINTLFSPEKNFIAAVDKYENNLDNLWHQSETNTLPENINDFDEHKDPIEALAEQAIQREIENIKSKKSSRDIQHGSEDVA
ncbi:MAG: hypothetical protein AB8E15_05100 [Bdellovibrionales bacterium]